MSHAHNDTIRLKLLINILNNSLIFAFTMQVGQNFLYPTSYIYNMFHILRKEHVQSLCPDSTIKWSPYIYYITYTQKNHFQFQLFYLFNLNITNGYDIGIDT